MNPETLAWWNERAARHPDTPMYRPQIERLERGEPVMSPEERDLMGEVKGKRILHAQCHIGTDTLSWALLGADVTGVDLSRTAIRQAERLSKHLKLPAQFIEANITDLPSDLKDFDAVVASIGVLPWIEDLDRWWRSLASTLKPGGQIVLVEFHPAAFTLEEKAGQLEHTYPWFHAEIRIDEQGTYAEPDAILQNTVTQEWAHSLGDILDGALRAGLQLETYREYQRLPWKAFEMMETGEEGFVLPSPLKERVPLMFGARFRLPISKGTVASG